MTLKYVRARRLWLKDESAFDERWVQERIAADPAILGLGELDLIQRERTVGKAGRLDLLLADRERERRYELELMLGPTDPSHIIRCIEYWDAEKRLYPAYDHIAVLVAEDITSRFLNVISLLSGSIPLIALQLEALEVGDQIVLNFTKVLDQTELRADDEAEQDERAPAVREDWEGRAPATLPLVDEIGKMIQASAGPTYGLTYMRHWIGVTDGTRTRNFIKMLPRKGHLRLSALHDGAAEWKSRLDAAGLDASLNRRGRLVVNIQPKELEPNRPLIDELVRASAREFLE
jgi:hypothetical protein